MVNYIKIPLDEILDTWGSSVSEIVGDNYSMDSSETVAVLPYARIFLMGNPTKQSATDLQGNENATDISFQCESYAEGQKALSTIYSIDEKSHVAMVSNGYIRTYGPQLIENTDTNIKRLVSRYTKVLTN